MNDRSRRLFGLLIGLGMGLWYGLVSQNINDLMMPGLPLYQPPPGRFLSILLQVVNGGLLGLTSAWTAEGITGVFFGALTGTLYSTLVTLRVAALSGDDVGSFTVLMLVLFLPRVLIMLPASGALRWVINVWERELETVMFSAKRLAGSVIVMFIGASLVGLMTMISSQGRFALQSTNDLVLAGLLAASEEQIPEELQPVDGFWQNATGAYTLDISDNPDNLPIARPFVEDGETEYAVLVYFSNGYRFGCVWTLPRPKPICRSY